jgi:hypothetical protein
MRSYQVKSTSLCSGIKGSWKPVYHGKIWSINRIRFGNRKWTLVCTVPRFSQLLYRYKPKSISDSLCVCVYCCSTYDKAVRVGGGVCVCVSCNYLALVLSLCCSTGVAARQVFVADHSGVSLLCKRSILEPLI